jgi:benzoyl-CoA reductase/2-hydroxyglutaryl-CoA dehydratase subunit BcrC/BadD/HgdB
MATDYRPMWKELHMNLDNHDKLMEVLGAAYGSLFLSQKNRPLRTSYLDFVMSEVHGLRIKELVEGKKKGTKVVGTYCTFVPEEIVLAAGAAMVGLCAGADFATDEVEKYLPRNMCALIKSTFGFKLGGVCPYLEASDLIVGENTCDGKKKAWEVFAGLVKDLYVMDLPQTKGDGARAMLAAEYKKFMVKMATLTGRVVTAQSLIDAITVVNAKRGAVHRLSALRAANPAPISGLDALLVNQIYFYEDPVRFTENINALCDELDERVASKTGAAAAQTPRILVSGCPMAVPNWKLPALIESHGGIVVGEESCTGERGTRNTVAENAASMDALVDAIVDRYLAIDCAVFTPNRERVDHIRQMAAAYKADGVVLYSLQYCTPYMVESMGIERELEAAGIPAVKIETDYSREDMGQLATRLQAFVERIGK